MELGTKSSFYPECSGNIISSQKGCGNVIPVKNEEILSCNFFNKSIIIFLYIKEKRLKIPVGINAHFTK